MIKIKLILSGLLLIKSFNLYSQVFSICEDQYNKILNSAYQRALSYTENMKLYWSTNNFEEQLLYKNSIIKLFEDPKSKAITDDIVPWSRQEDLHTIESYFTILDKNINYKQNEIIYDISKPDKIIYNNIGKFYYIIVSTDKTILKNKTDKNIRKRLIIVKVDNISAILPTYKLINIVSDDPNNKFPGTTVDIEFCIDNNPTINRTDYTKSIESSGNVNGLEKNGQAERLDQQQSIESKPDKIQLSKNKQKPEDSFNVNFNLTNMVFKRGASKIITWEGTNQPIDLLYYHENEKQIPNVHKLLKSNYIENSFVWNIPKNLKPGNYILELRGKNGNSDTENIKIRRKIPMGLKVFLPVVVAGIIIAIQPPPPPPDQALPDPNPLIK